MSRPAGVGEGAGNDLWRFFEQAGRLKRVARKGWLRCGIELPESVADHSHRVTVLALVLSRRHEDLDASRCVAMALVHDLAEAVVGDITPWDGVPVEEKHRREQAAMADLAGLAGDSHVAELWEEYAAGRSPEARFVKSLDALETVLQALEYADDAGLPRADLDRFWDSAERRIVHPAIRSLFAELGAARDARQRT